MTADCVEQIILLDQNLNRSEIENRTLNLLYMMHGHTRASRIAELEFSPHKSDEDTAELENLYLQVICKSPFQETPEGVGEIISKALSMRMEDQCDEHQSTRFTCRMQFSQRSVEESINPEFVTDYYAAFFTRADKNLIPKMKSYIDSVIKRELINYYLDLHRIPAELRSTESMRTYIEEKTKSFRTGILRFFVDSRAPEFSRDSLDALTKFLHEKISVRQLKLNDDEKISDLHKLIEDAKQERQRSSPAV